MLLMMSGFCWAPEWEEPIAPVTLKKPECFENQQVKIWCGLCQWSIEAESAVIYDPEAVHGGLEPERLKKSQL